MDQQEGFHRCGRARSASALATVVALCFIFLLAPPPQAEAAFGLTSFDVAFTQEDGSPATQAGSHPFEYSVSYEINNTEVEPFTWKLDGEIKDLIVGQIPGFVGNATAMPRCSSVDFNTSLETNCGNETAVGVVAASIAAPIQFVSQPVYNLEPPPGVAARLGFIVFRAVPVVIDITARGGGDHNLLGSLSYTSQAAAVYGGHLKLWGNPADPAHDPIRGECLGSSVSLFEPRFESVGNCPSHITSPVAFLTLPGSCTGPARTTYEMRSWQNSEVWVQGGVVTHDNASPPNPQGFTGCGKLGFAPRVSSQATTDSAESGTGLSFSVDFDDEGLADPDGIAQSQVKKAEVALPEGITINPSVGEGLGVCEPDDLEDETLRSGPGEGCPNSSKLGTVRIESPLVDQPIDGSVYLAEQDDPRTTRPGAENPFDSLIALHMVLRNEILGVLIKQSLKVEPDPETGQLVTTLDDIPQLPFSKFDFHFREGQRAPLVTPAACGTYETEAKFYPWSDPGNPRTVVSSFEINEGIDGGPCPPGGIPPFKPHFEAGSINNNAGSFSPFAMRLIRQDGEQDMTKFSSVLPPGVLGSLAGVSKCPDALVALAKTKTGREELAAPSCPPNSAIGRTLAGAGVGSALTYVGGGIYLGGPYKGAPLSVISITPAVAGPFDAGTVVVRLGLDLNPVTAEVEVDGAASDPIPHILKGIVLKVRDLRVHVDRPAFTLNPTSCDESSAKATLFGSFADVFDPADDFPVALASRYQAANCLNLGYKPHLGIRLKGGTGRGAFPGFRAIYDPRPGDANLEGLVLRLPRSAFLEQGHIRTICTRVQFAAEACPKASQYGYIRAWTPLLDTPLEGPVYLRSSNNKLPDVVFDLQGIVDIEVATRIDSVNGGIRATLTNLPDAPITKVFLRMQGGKKGLVVNSRHLCRGRARANVRFSGQNGKRRNVKPIVRPTGCKRKRAKRSSHGRAQRQGLSGFSAAG